MIETHSQTSRRGRWLLLLTGLGLFLAPRGVPTEASDRRPVARIGVVSDGPDQRQDNFNRLFKQEMRHVAAGAYEIEFPADAEVDGAWTAAGITAAVDELLGRSDLDAIVALGIGVAADVCGRSEVATPVAVPFTFGDCSTRCPSQPEFRTRSIDLRAFVARDLRAFREVTPFTRVAVLIDPTWPEACSGAEAAPEGIGIELVAFDGTNPNVVDELPAGIDAVYLMPLEQLDDEALARLAGRLTERGLPTFSMLGESEVDRGVLAGMNTRATVAAFARGAALDVLDLLEGRGGERITPARPGGQLTLNMATARALGLSPSWKLRTMARLLHDEDSRGDRPMDLETAIARAVAANLDLAVRQRRVAAGAENVREARSAYRPRLEVALAGVAIDDEHATPALGQYARLAAGSLTLTQLIYSDAATGNVAIQQDLQAAREHDWQALRLDIGRAAVSAYTGVLRTGALIRVRKQQVDLTRTNLELARLRRSLGATAASEVHRWEAELATARAGVLEALSLHRSSERQLSRLLNEPLATRWGAQQPELPAALDALGGADAVALLETLEGYDRLLSSLVEEALEKAPELAALEAAISAQERAWQAARRASYAPTVGLEAELSEILAKDTDRGVDLGDFGDLIPESEDTSWQVGLQASLPIATGGGNRARRVRAGEELAALRIDRHNTREKLAQRALAALDTATASWSTISLRRQAAEAATQTQELVRAAYARGAASILDLLDAQNNALDAELAAVTSVYDFLDDWAEVQRAVAGGAMAGSGAP